MKNLILIGSPLIEDRLAVANILNQKMSNSIMLDGAQCGKMDPFIANKTNLTMIFDNINFLLKSFINNDNLDNIVFSWNFNNQDSINSISRNFEKSINIVPVSLLPSLQSADSKDLIDQILQYQSLSTIKYDNSSMSPSKIASEIMLQI